MSEYLAIKNWDKYQGGYPGRRDWIKDWTAKDEDDGYEKLTFFERQVLDGIRRLRGRLGKNPPNDPSYIARSMHAVRTDIPHVPHAVRTLLARGFLVLTNQQVDVLVSGKNKKENKKENREEKKEAAASPLDDVFLLPQEIPTKLWEDYLEMRRKKRAPATEHAKELLVKKLLEFKALGHDIGKILENSITGNWTDVYAPKQEQANGTNKAQQRENRIIEQTKRIALARRGNSQVPLALQSGDGRIGVNGLAGNARDVRPAGSNRGDGLPLAQSAKAGST